MRTGKVPASLHPLIHEETKKPYLEVYPSRPVSPVKFRIEEENRAGGEPREPTQLGGGEAAREAEDEFGAIERQAIGMEDHYFHLGTMRPRHGQEADVPPARREARLVKN